MPIRRLDVLAGALEACRSHIVTAAVFSLAINVLHLAAPLYMMQVYDRVMASGSKMTLAMLSLLMLVAFGAQAGLDRARAGVLAAASARLDRLLAGRAYMAMMNAVVRSGKDQQSALRDLDACRQFVSGPGMTAILDMPWMPLYVFITFALHWAIGLFTLLCASALVALAVLSELRLRPLAREAQTSGGAAYAWAEASLRNAHVVHAMAMMQGLLRRWSGTRVEAIKQEHLVAEKTAGLSSLVRFLRLSMQSLVLGLGAWLVIDRSMSPGAIFAASLLLGRALQPVEQIIGQWQSMLSAYAAFARLNSVLASETSVLPMRTAAPSQNHGRLIADQLGYAVAGRPEPILGGVSFVIEPGDSIGLIGPSGAGKSTLVRLMVGALVPTCGSVTFGGIELSRLTTYGGRSCIGYMPQDVGLFDDTIAANISRFEMDSAAEVVRAARIAGAHDLIMGLPGGYQCRIGTDGAVLSGGMRQRIGLARAVYGNPRILVLDEPSANLDRVGDTVLDDCLRQLQARGITVIVISHRPSTTALMSKFLVMMDGRLSAFGTRQEVVGILSANRRSGGIVAPRAAGDFSTGHQRAAS